MIGIIGGLGPAAGVDLFHKIIEETIAARDQDHPSVALLSFADQIPDRATYINDPTKPNPVPPLWRVVQHLAQMGAKVAGIPCVTAHVPVIYGVLKEKLAAQGADLNLMSMVEETVSFIRQDLVGVQRVGAISTWTTFRNQLFIKPLEKAGYTVIRQTAEIQDGVEAAIYDPLFGIKAHSTPVHPQARQNLLKALRHLRAEGAEAVILGCTELPLGVPEPEIEGVRTIDPTRALARAMVRAVAPHRLRPFAGG